MKYLLLIFFCFFGVSSWAQPTSESAAYVYSKEQYGYDFLNAINPIRIAKNGSVWCQPYAKGFLKIGNFKGTQPVFLPNDLYPYFQQLIEWNDNEYICASSEILVLKNKKLVQRFPLSNGYFWARDFVVHDSQIYFINSDSFYQKHDFCAFDGKHIKVIKSFHFSKKMDGVSLKKRNGKLYLIFAGNSLIENYEMNNDKLISIRQFKIQTSFNLIHQFWNENHFTFFDADKNLVELNRGKLKATSTVGVGDFYPENFKTSFDGNQKYIYSYSNGRFTTVANSSIGDVYATVTYSKESNSYYCGTGTKFVRLFPHIRLYPRLFYNSHSNSVFTLQQDYLGQIWAGSYQNTLSIIKNQNTEIEQSKLDFKFLNGGQRIDQNLMLFTESYKGVLLYKSANVYQKMIDSLQVFYSYTSSDQKIYLGTFQQGLWFAKVSDLQKNTSVNWTKINQKQGLTIGNVLSICEDKFKNIWVSSSRGIGVYNPSTGKAKSWEVEKLNLPHMGALSMLKDHRQTLWIGARDGSLLYYDGKSKTDFQLQNFKKIKHPFFESGAKISFLNQWKNYLIIGAENKVLLFDLKKWHENKSVFVRYLNPMEINLTSNTEQNTCLTDFRDSSVWFSTNDMVYQLDLKKWFSLPLFKVNPSILILKDSSEIECSSTSKIKFKPTENSFDIQIDYQSLDNMPRFLNGVLVKKGEIPVFGQPNLNTKFHFGNLSSGEYVFYVRICQQDGSFTTNSYSIIINRFFWQNWWFWALISLFPIGFVFFYFQKQNQLAKQEQQLSQLNLSSLSNQFRPHFMLNALNSIGSQMQNNRIAESVISRLGESITLLYGVSQKNQHEHAFANEWKLVLNNIEIQRLLYLPELELEIENLECMDSNFQVPIGIIQIPVENALLHGLRNKTKGEIRLTIRFESNANSFSITIDDTGVGRQKSVKINRFKSNGNGLKVLEEVILIVNKRNNNKINFTIEDKENESGTVVKINFKKI